MLRSLSARLVLLYVLSATLLIVLVAGAVTLFALASFGRVAQQAVNSVAREVPQVAREEMQGRSLAYAAPDIARRLAQPGLLIAVRASGKGYDRPLAISQGDEQPGNVDVIPVPPGSMPQLEDGPPGGAPPRGLPQGQMPALQAPPGQGPPPGMPPPQTGGGGRPGEYPQHWGGGFLFRLNGMMGLHPELVAIPGGRVAIIPNTRPLEASMAAFWRWLVPVAILAVVGAFLFGRYITNQVMRPLVETTRSLQRFANGDFTPRPVVASRRDEIGELVTAYNDAAKQVAAAFDERRKAEDRMRQFVADAGHELRTPLTVLMGFIDVLRPRLSGDERTAEGFEIMRAESRRMRALIDKLIRLARLETDGESGGMRSDFDLGETARRASAALGLLDGNERIRVEAASGVIVNADESEMYDAIANLLENALKYAPGSPVSILVAVRDGSALLEVSDEGPGLDPAEQRSVFERFYRGHSRGESDGFGLGLSIVKRTALRAGGDVGVESEPGRGARFWMRLPLVKLPVATSPA